MPPIHHATELYSNWRKTDRGAHEMKQGAPNLSPNITTSQVTSNNDPQQTDQWSDWATGFNIPTDVTQHFGHGLSGQATALVLTMWTTAGNTAVA